jgi:ribosome-binding protein aMBF1 (putative translation factor)
VITTLNKNRTNLELSNNTTKLHKIFDYTLHINIGKQTQKLRESRCLSQQDLVAKCNFEKTNMSRFEAGRVNPMARITNSGPASSLTA